MKGIDMKKISSIISLSFLVIFLLVSNVYSFGWVKYKTDNDDNVYFYKKETIKHLTKDIVQVSIKTVFSDEGKKYELKFLGENGLPDAKKYNSLSYEISLEKIDCKNNRSQFLSLTSYDADDKILFPYSYKEQKWEDINPDSLLDILQKKVCK
jgi:hypothetical protein